MQDILILFCADDSATQKVGTALAQTIVAPSVLTLTGDIGAGKTTLIRAMLRGLGVKGPIKSPTFALVEPYHLKDRSIIHFDLYRLVDPEELMYLGMRDYLEDEAIICIEWPERAGRYCPEADIAARFEILSEGRLLKLFAHTASGAKLIHQMRQLLSNKEPSIEIR